MPTLKYRKLDLVLYEGVLPVIALTLSKACSFESEKTDWRKLRSGFSSELVDGEAAESVTHWICSRLSRI